MKRWNIINNALTITIENNYNQTTKLSLQNMKVHSNTIKYELLFS